MQKFSTKCQQAELSNVSKGLYTMTEYEYKVDLISKSQCKIILINMNRGKQPYDHVNT